jgi:serine/threonine-protein kinase HipA
MAEQFKRMVFNVVSRNQDDHVKNIAFLMDRDGVWGLAPAYDVTYAYAPSNRWLARHQMSVSGRRDDFVMSDLLEAASIARLSSSRGHDIIEQVQAAVRAWPEFGTEAGVPVERIEQIGRAHRLNIPQRRGP